MIPIRYIVDALNSVKKITHHTRVVVGAVIVRDNMVLGQQRSFPAWTAGRWEFPGGVVERGESEHQALVREVDEELGVTVVPGVRVGGDAPLPGGRVLRLYAARLKCAQDEPTPKEHAAVTWYKSYELGNVVWLPADNLLLPDIMKVLTCTCDCGIVTDRPIA
jgi:8-oxo-dGTP diphosphatase